MSQCDQISLNVCVCVHLCYSAYMIESEGNFMNSALPLHLLVGSKITLRFQTCRASHHYPMSHPDGPSSQDSECLAGHKPQVSSGTWWPVSSEAGSCLSCHRAKAFPKSTDNGAVSMTLYDNLKHCEGDPAGVSQDRLKNSETSWGPWYL